MTFASARSLRYCGVCQTLRQAPEINLLLADGAPAGQDVFHVHLHVVPRFEQDGFGFQFSPAYDQQPDRAELERMAARIRQVV